jgi:glycosyltransferase involved in cell wall biosynthesis
MRSMEQLRIAWLLPSMARGSYWHPVFSEFAKRFPNTVFYTGLWPGFLPGYEGRFRIKVVGQTRFLPLGNRWLALPSMQIVFHLLGFRPHVVFVLGFSLWSIIALALKPLLRYKVVQVYTGSSAAADALSSRIRLFARRAMVRRTEACITNSQKGKDYLRRVLHAEASRVQASPFEVPCVDAFSTQRRTEDLQLPHLRHPVLIVIGRLIPVKGLHLLLQACAMLREKGVDSFSLLIVGDGPQRRSLERLTVELGLESNVHWTGWVEYVKVGSLLLNSDLLVFPTLGDTWGMVVLESMAAGKAILCSKWAGAAEMVVPGDNGYVFDPYQPESLAELIRKFCVDPRLAESMGNRSLSLIESHTPARAAGFLAGIVGACTIAAGRTRD